MGSIFPNYVLYEFVTLFVVLDPIATLPVFVAVTAGLTRRQSLLVAFLALGVSFLVLLFFIVAGQHLLGALKIPMASFQLAGSLVLLLFGLKMVLGKISEEAADAGAGAGLLDRAIYPLAVPGIAGAGAMLTVVLLTDNNVLSFAEQATTTAILALCLSVMFVLFALAAAIFRPARPTRHRDREPCLRTDSGQHRRDQPRHCDQDELRNDDRLAVRRTGSER